MAWKIFSTLNLLILVSSMELQCHQCTLIWMEWARIFSCFIIENYTLDNATYRQYDLELGKTYQITIKQFKASGTYWYEIIIDGEPKFKIEIPHQPISYSNVKAYTSHKNFAQFLPGLDISVDSFTSEFGSVCNFKVQQGQD